MPSISFNYQQCGIEAATLNGSRSGQVAHDLSLFSAPPKLGNSLDDLLSDIITQHNKAFFDTNRQGIANIILLAHEMGLVSEQEIDKSGEEGWQGFHHLYEKSITAISRSLSEEAAAIVGDTQEGHEIQNLDLLLDSVSGDFYLFVACPPRFTQLSLTNLPFVLRQIVYSCLHWLVTDAGFGIFSDDLKDYNGLFDEEIEVFKKIREEMPKAGLDEIASFICNMEDCYPFNDWYGDDFDSIFERCNLFDEVLKNSVADIFGPVLKIEEVKKNIGQWRREKSVLCQNPWAEFIAKTVEVWKDSRRNPIKDTHSVISMEGDDCGEVALYYGQAIGLGLPWEDYVTEGFFENLYNAGESPVGRSLLQPDTLPALAAKLKLLAKAQGLLSLAEKINIRMENSNGSA